MSEAQSSSSYPAELTTIDHQRLAMHQP